MVFQVNGEVMEHETRQLPGTCIERGVKPQGTETGKWGSDGTREEVAQAATWNMRSKP